MSSSVGLTSPSKKCDTYCSATRSHSHRWASAFANSRCRASNPLPNWMYAESTARASDIVKSASGSTIPRKLRRDRAAERPAGIPRTHAIKARFVKNDKKATVLPNQANARQFHEQGEKRDQKEVPMCLIQHAVQGHPDVILWARPKTARRCSPVAAPTWFQPPVPWNKQRRSITKTGWPRFSQVAGCGAETPGETLRVAGKGVVMLIKRPQGIGAGGHREMSIIRKIGYHRQNGCFRSAAARVVLPQAVRLGSGKGSRQSWL